MGLAKLIHVPKTPFLGHSRKFPASLINSRKIPPLQSTKHPTIRLFATAAMVKAIRVYEHGGPEASLSLSLSVK